MTMKNIVLVFDIGEDGRRSNPPIVASFESLADAEKIFGNRYHYQVLPCYESIEDFGVNSPNGRRARALAKLTDEDRAALGVR